MMECCVDSGWQLDAIGAAELEFVARPFLASACEIASQRRWVLR
jgi:hypothetical protein